jgi:hypothetical protein
LPGDAEGVFGVLHVVVTALLTALVGALLLRWRLPDASWSERTALGVVAGLSVLAYRLAANMPQLNADGIPGLSANDLLCPAITYVVLSVSAAFRPPPDAHRWAQARALLTVVSFATNVVTI